MDRVEHWLWLSLQPHYARLILRGEKAVELRRARPLHAEGSGALLYASSPVMAVVGECRIDTVRETTPEGLWPHVSRLAGLNRQKYDEYFSGASRAVAMSLRDVVVWRTPVPLASIRQLWPNFMPAQSFRYLSTAEVIQLRHSAYWEALPKPA